jgi:hypothetical protein
MEGWTRQQLAAIGDAPEIFIAPIGADGTTNTATMIWVVRHGEDLYIRSYRAATGAWYRAARRSGRARIRAAGIELDVVVTPHAGDRAALDTAYRTKYGRSSYVDVMVADAVAATTFRLSPTERNP